jgi:hypothetical protein
VHVLGETSAGPTRLHLAVVQVLKDYQRRLQQALAAVRPSLPALPQHLPSLSAAMPSFAALPSVSALSNVPAFRDLEAMATFEDIATSTPTRSGADAGADAQHARPATTYRRMPSLPRIADLSQMPAFRDLQNMESFEDIGNVYDKVSVRAWARSSLAAAKDMLPDLSGVRSSAASGVRASVAAAQTALQRALPVMNLPDWSLPFAGTAHRQKDPASSRPHSPSWRQKLGAASAALLEQAEQDGVFVRSPFSGVTHQYWDHAPVLQHCKPCCFTYCPQCCSGCFQTAELEPSLRTSCRLQRPCSSCRAQCRR